MGLGKKRPESQYPEVPHNSESCSSRGTEQPQSMDFQGRDLNHSAPGEILTAGPLIPRNKLGWPENRGQGNGPGASHKSLFWLSFFRGSFPWRSTPAYIPWNLWGSQGAESRDDVHFLGLLFSALLLRVFQNPVLRMQRNSVPNTPFIQRVPAGGSLESTG